MTAVFDPTVRPISPQIPEQAAPPRIPAQRLPKRRPRQPAPARPPATRGVFWSNSELPPATAPPIVQHGPIAYVVEFLAQPEAGTTRAQRFLDAHPACGPQGCLHCATSQDRCPDCRVASWARVAVHVAAHRARHAKEGP